MWFLLLLLFVWENLKTMHVHNAITVSWNLDIGAFLMSMLSILLTFTNFSFSYCFTVYVEWRFNKFLMYKLFYMKYFKWQNIVLYVHHFFRYVQLLHLGLKIREDRAFINLRNFNQQQSDVCMLRLFESFMESAPQLVLQLYIMVSTDEWNPWTGS